MDFGNCELRERDSLMALGSEFKVIPFQAVRCSIATDDHTSFTEKVSCEALVGVTHFGYLPFM